MLVQTNTVVTFLTKCLIYKLVCWKNQNRVSVCRSSQKLHHKLKSHAGSPSTKVILSTFSLTSAGQHICARNKHYVAAPLTQQHTHTDEHPSWKPIGPSHSTLHDCQGLSWVCFHHFDQNNRTCEITDL